MDREEIRTKCLELAVRGGLTKDEILMRAKDYESYITGPTEESPKAKKPSVITKTANPDVLS